MYYDLQCQRKKKVDDNALVQCKCYPMTLSCTLKIKDKKDRKEEIKCIKIYQYDARKYQALMIPIRCDATKCCINI